MLSEPRGGLPDRLAHVACFTVTFLASHTSSASSLDVGIDSMLMFVLFLETIRTGGMRVIHIPVKTEETQRLRIKFVLYCPICAFKLENQTSSLLSEIKLSNVSQGLAFSNHC